MILVCWRKGGPGNRSHFEILRAFSPRASVPAPVDEFVKSLQLGESGVALVTVWSVVFGCGLSALLSVGIGLVYRRVHAEAGYSQTLAQSLVLMSMITALIMLIIGSNIARAFSLVGALSIIRFRTAIKSPQDIAFLFFAMAIGMACGTRFYSIAIVGFVLISVVVILLRVLDFASYPERREFLLSVSFHIGVDYESLLSPVLEKYFSAHSLAYVETTRQGTLRDVVYSVVPKDGTKDREVLEELTKLNDNLKVSLRSVRHAIEVP